MREQKTDNREQKRTIRNNGKQGHFSQSVESQRDPQKHITPNISENKREQN